MRVLPGYLTFHLGDLAAVSGRQLIMRLLATLLLWVSAAVSANQSLIVDGNYLRYDGTEYESMFFPCQTTEVWSIDGGNAFAALVDYYRNSRTNTSGEMRISLMLNVAPTDKLENPDSHLDAVAKVSAIISISEDETEVGSCRETRS